MKIFGPVTNEETTVWRIEKKIKIRETLSETKHTR